jgi:hypothetical protein
MPIGGLGFVELVLGHGQLWDKCLRPPLPSLYSAARRGPTNHGSIGRPQSGRDPRGNEALAVGLGLGD